MFKLGECGEFPSQIDKEITACSAIRVFARPLTMQSYAMDAHRIAEKKQRQKYPKKNTCPSKETYLRRIRMGVG